MTERELRHELANEQMTITLLLNVLQQWLYAPVVAPESLTATTQDILRIGKEQGRI
jgi:hypothetical protein